MAAFKKYIRHGAVVLKNEGPVSLALKTLKKVESRKKQKSENPLDKIAFTSLVARADVLQADWSNHPYKPGKATHTAPYIVNWVMSPPSGGGGHQNIFRFIEYLDAKGYKNNIYLYSTYDDMTLAQAKDNVKAYCNAKNMSFYRYKGKMLDADIVFATGWETAYPVFNDFTRARKMYFVQDFEPYFYAIGTNYILAENTYRFGFHGISAGGWLASTLKKEYGMKCDYYNFGADTKLYRFENTGVRKEVFFYARPVTERRGFELGIMALELFHKLMPDYVIHLAGWDVSGYDVPFPYINHKAMQLEELTDLYNKCATALVLSLTNMSLLPLELLACGTIPVINDAPNNRLVSNNPYIRYTEPSPAALAQAMIDTVRNKELPKIAKLAAQSVQGESWEIACDKFEKILQKELSNV
jgi:glycosyltransferase involved in cell wall biosynthesis